MNGTVPQPANRRHQLDEVLLAYLEGTDVLSWPGSDGLTVEDILRKYPEAVAASRVPDVNELKTRHPELALELADFFAEQGRISSALEAETRRGDSSRV